MCMEFSWILTLHSSIHAWCVCIWDTSLHLSIIIQICIWDNIRFLPYICSYTPTVAFIWDFGDYMRYLPYTCSYMCAVALVWEFLDYMEFLPNNFAWDFWDHYMRFLPTLVLKPPLLPLYGILGIITMDSYPTFVFLLPLYPLYGILGIISWDSYPTFVLILPL